MPPGPSLLKSVTFVLAGRTTLSENCPPGHIVVDYAIAERSPHLRIYLPRSVRDDRPLLPIQLGDVDPAGFKLYIEWLTTGVVDFSTQRSLGLDSCTDLIYAHIVGSMFSQPHFQDYIIDTLAFILGPAQEFDQKVLELIFLEKHASSVLRQFITDKMFAHERKMLSMTRHSVEDIVTATSDVKGCEYHIHENGVCYKHGRADQVQGGEGEDRLRADKWSIDDDPELNAMAAQYLGRTTATSTTKKKPPVPLLLPRISTALDERPNQKHSLVSQTKKSPLKTVHTLSLPRRGSIASSRKLPSPQPSIRSPVANIDIDKPLPPTPSSRRSSSALSFDAILPIRSSVDITSVGAVHKPSTQELVLECLGRFSPALARTSMNPPFEEYLMRSPMNPPRPISPPDDYSFPATTPLSPPSTYSNVLSTPSSSSSSGSIPPSLRPGSQPSSPHPTRNLTFAPLPTPRSTRTATPLHASPKDILHTSAPPPSSEPSPCTFSPPPSPRLSIQPVQRPYHISPSSPSLPHFAPLIKRKPAPPRGLDWLEQWDRLFELQGTQGFGLRRGEKRERRSRFMEILGSVNVKADR
jgi:hypothetical protein